MNAEALLDWGFELFKTECGDYDVSKAAEDRFRRHYGRVARHYQSKGADWEEVRRELSYWLKMQGRQAKVLTDISREVTVSEEALVESVKIVSFWKRLNTSLCNTADLEVVAEAS